MIRNKYLIILGLAIGVGCKKDPSLVGPTDSYSTANYPATLSRL